MKKFFILLTVPSLTLGVFTGCTQQETTNQGLETLNITEIINEDYEVEINNDTDSYINESDIDNNDIESKINNFE